MYLGYLGGGAIMLGPSSTAINHINTARDVSVVQVASVDRGREWVASSVPADDASLSAFAYARFASIVVEIDRVLVGEWAGRSIAYEEQVFDWDQVDMLRAAMPPEPAIFFLHFKQGTLDDGYVRLVGEHGLIASNSQAVEVPGLSGEAGDEFLKELVGLPFQDVVEGIAR